MLQLKLWRRWRNAFQLIVANSEAVKRRLIAEDITPIEVVWNGVPQRSLRPPLRRPPTIAFAGRLVREKGVDVLLRAFAKIVTHIPEARLLLAGGGPERERLTRQIADLGLSSTVAMLGYLSRLEMERHFNEAWVQAVPSRWEEPCANVVLEAMMRGTAVVASDSGGMPEMVRDGQSGLLVLPDDTEALAQALLRLLQDRTAAERMGRVGHEIALAHFRQEICVERFVHFYQMLTESRMREAR